MARKKPDYTHVNVPQIQDYCDDLGFKWHWKNQEQGHMVVESDEFEVYVWVQRMTVMVRKRHGVQLSHPETKPMPNRVFNATDFTKLILAGKKPTSKKKGTQPLKPYVRGHGERKVVVMTIPAGTPEHIERKAREAQRRLAKSISRPYVYDDDIL